MKTIKYMALAALICCGQLAKGMFSSKDQSATFTTSNTGVNIDTLLIELGNMLDKLITSGYTQKDAALFSPLKLKCDQALISLKNEKSKKLSSSCQQFDFIGQVLEENYSNKFGPQKEIVLKTFKDKWFTDIEGFSKLKRKLGNGSRKIKLGKTDYTVKEVEYK